ncbi:MAG: Crp/Fnr family transcriptional regulator [Fibrobacterales bacterium]
MIKDKLELLKGVDLFSSLDNAQLALISELVLSRSYKKDENIILEDDSEDQALFIIVDGDVKVYISGLDGRETILAMLGTGDFFGEMSLIDGEPRSASVKSVTNTEILVLRRSDFREEMVKFPDLAMSLLEEMSRRLRKSNKQVGSLSLMTVYGRIAATILNLMEEKGVRIHAQNGQMIVAIKNKPTQQQLAEMSGTTRESVSRVLKTLQKKGCISVAGKDLLILQEEELRS